MGVRSCPAKGLWRSMRVRHRGHVSGSGSLARAHRERHDPQKVCAQGCALAAKGAARHTGHFSGVSSSSSSGAELSGVFQDARSSWKSRVGVGLRLIKAGMEARWLVNHSVVWCWMKGPLAGLTRALSTSRAVESQRDCGDRGALASSSRRGSLRSRWAAMDRCLLLGGGGNCKIKADLISLHAWAQGMTLGPSGIHSCSFLTSASPIVSGKTGVQSFWLYTISNHLLRGCRCSFSFIIISLFRGHWDFS